MTSYVADVTFRTDKIIKNDLIFLKEKKFLQN